ncbi:bifunctional protein-disulfide isomerase/oxidoreductase DsbC [Thalassotalea atypica]|uniref:bifunctional protein-disulfide isomerase/oxidoreductase DsbC n=1 Tax=Thalassotalea atypica TaxID=2054316 RepID=UPI002573F37A|nr:bifunctional protein-disulfide isomerase/oxidoreductase DsbC [Thalassotalea atypica]
MLFRAHTALLKHALKILTLTTTVIFSSISMAATSPNVPSTIAKPIEGFNVEALKKSINETIGLTVIEALPSPVAGIAEIITDQGLFYTTYDGKYLIQGTMFGLSEQTVTNVTEATMSKMRLIGLEKFDNDTITYKAKNEKHVITVFTDITCGYCRKMHEQMDEYNDLGITIRYLAYPRAGITDRSGVFTQGFQDLRSIWCNENPEQALTKAKSGSGVPQRICDKPVAEEFNFGRQIGVNATPALVLADGSLRPGYIPPKDLIQLLDSM